MWPRKLLHSRVGPPALLLVLCALPLRAQAQTPQPMLHSEDSGTPIVDSAEAMRVTGIIQCWCGGCTNQTLHDCTCGLAAGERQKVAAALGQGQSPDALIAAYVSEHGPQVRIVPEKSGLNLIGWAIPFVASLVALAILVVTLLAWRRRDIANQGGDTAPAKGGSQADRVYRDRLAKELREFDA